MCASPRAIYERLFENCLERGAAKLSMRNTTLATVLDNQSHCFEIIPPPPSQLSEHWPLPNSILDCWPSRIFFPMRASDLPRFARNSFELLNLNHYFSEKKQFSPPAHTHKPICKQTNKKNRNELKSKSGGGGAINQLNKEHFTTPCDGIMSRQRHLLAAKEEGQRNNNLCQCITLIQEAPQKNQKKKLRKFWEFFLRQGRSWMP